jgi:invasion protein IalB
MGDIRPRAILTLSIAAIGAIAAQSHAQDRTTATYEDWVVECQKGAGSPPRQTCDMAQLTLVQGKNAPYSRVALESPKIGGQLKLVVQVPVNVSIASNVVLRTGDADPGLTVPFARCTPEGCFADLVVGDDAAKKLRAAGGGGHLNFVDAAGRQVVIPLSFKGFSQALDALVKLSKQ